MIDPSSVIPVSVIIPNFNSANFLRECVASINSSNPPGEIIIVDDCSDDGSREVAQDLLSEYPNVELLLRESNGGAAAARYDGFAAANYEWISFVDADDFVESGAIQCAYSKVLEDDSDICIFDMWRYSAGRSWAAMKLHLADFPKSGRQAVVETLGAWKIHPLGVARKQLYLSAYRNFSETCLNADELLTRIVFAAARKVSFCEKKYFYRLNAESSTQIKSHRRLSMLDSHIWLTDFCRSFPEVSAEKIERDAIHAAWTFWAQRRDYAEGAVTDALAKFFPKFYRVSSISRWIWRSPKYLAAFALMTAMVKIKSRP